MTARADHVHDLWRKDNALSIATEHCRWACQQGMGPGDVLRSVGLRVHGHPSWGYVAGRLAAEWRALGKALQEAA